MNLPCEKTAIIERCFATEHKSLVGHNSQKKKKKKPEAHKSQRSIPKEKDLLCGAAISCFARSWSVKYTKGVQSIVKPGIAQWKLSHAAVQQKGFLSLKCVCLFLLYVNILTI